MDRKRRMVRTETGRCKRLATGAVLALMLSGAPPIIVSAHAQSQTSEKPEKKEDALDKVGDIATGPARDVGVVKTTIDPFLVEAAKQPYAPAGSCTAITAELKKLNAVLGPDFGANVKDNEDKAEKLALAGGESLVNSLIPFRGLVREVSGAAPADRRKAAAISAGTARRGYLRGLAQSRKCRIP